MRIKITLCLFTVALGMLPPAFGNPDSDINMLIVRPHKRKEITDEEDKASLKFYNLAKDESKALEDKKALGDVATAIRLNPNFVKAYILRGECFSSLDDFEQAKLSFIDAYRVSLTAPPEDKNLVVESMKRLEPFFKREDKLKIFLSMCDKMIESFRDPQSYLTRGKCEEDLRLFEKAIEDFDLSAKSKNLRIKSDIGSAECYTFLGKHSDAIKKLTDAIEFVKGNGNKFLENGNYRLYALRARSYTAVGQKALAQADLRKCRIYDQEILDLVPFQSGAARIP